MDDMRRGGQPAIESLGDAAVRSALRGYMAGLPAFNRDQTLEALARRFNICRDWAVFLDRYQVLMMPNSWQRQSPSMPTTVRPSKCTSCWPRQARCSAPP